MMKGYEDVSRAMREIVEETCMKDDVVLNQRAYVSIYNPLFDKKYNLGYWI